MKKTTRRCTLLVLAYQNFMGLPKVHKAGVPLRPIVSSRGSVTYNTSKELARILKPLAGRSTFSVQNTMDFVEQVKNIRLQPQECIVSYDVKALITSVPIKPAISDHKTTTRR